MTIFTGQNALKFIIGMNVVVFWMQEGILNLPDLNFPEPFSVERGSIASILSSMFHHVDAAHLMANMFGLYVYGWDVFVRTSAKSWSSAWAVLTIYLGSGIGASLGVIGLSRHLESQWRRRLQKNRIKFQSVCSNNWFCDSLGLATATMPFVDLYTNVAHADEISALAFYRMTHRVGASGAVYGIMGARIYTSLFSPNHSRLNSNDIFFLILQLAYELQNTPIDLNDLWQIFVIGKDGDRVDHASHVFGLLCGSILAFIWKKLVCNRLRYRFTGQGRRLGTRS